MKVATIEYYDPFWTHSQCVDIAALLPPDFVDGLISSRVGMGISRLSGAFLVTPRW